MLKTKAGFADKPKKVVVGLSVCMRIAELIKQLQYGNQRQTPSNSVNLTTLVKFIQVVEVVSG